MTFDSLQFLLVVYTSSKKPSFLPSACLMFDLLFLPSRSHVLCLYLKITDLRRNPQTFASFLLLCMLFIICVTPILYIAVKLCYIFRVFHLIAEWLMLNVFRHYSALKL